VAERPIKIRLAEIDTPERGQPWATRAKQVLSDIRGSTAVEAASCEAICQ
jgi:endonuclease YncB( thermonuclease family)